jgi:hypothetical protein
VARTTSTTSDAPTGGATPSVESMPLIVSAASGDRLAALRDLRDLVARALVTTESARDVAALSRQMTDVLAQIEAVEKAAPEKKGTALDELQNRRAARKPGAARSAGA